MRFKISRQSLVSLMLLASITACGKQTETKTVVVDNQETLDKLNKSETDAKTALTEKTDAEAAKKAAESDAEAAKTALEKAEKAKAESQTTQAKIVRLLSYMHKEKISTIDLKSHLADQVKAITTEIGTPAEGEVAASGLIGQVLSDTKAIADFDKQLTDLVVKLGKLQSDRATRLAFLKAQAQLSDEDKKDLADLTHINELTESVETAKKTWETGLADLGTKKASRTASNEVYQQLVLELSDLQSAAEYYSGTDIGTSLNAEVQAKQVEVEAAQKVFEKAKTEVTAAIAVEVLALRDLKDKVKELKKAEDDYQAATENSISATISTQGETTTARAKALETLAQDEGNLAKAQADKARLQGLQAEADELLAILAAAEVVAPQ